MLLVGIHNFAFLGSCLYNKAALRKGDIVHLLIPNCTDYHCFVFGSWMCEAVVSAADPGVSTGQLISECLFDVSHFPNKQPKIRQISVPRI